MSRVRPPSFAPKFQVATASHLADRNPVSECMCPTAGSRSECIESGQDFCRAPHLATRIRCLRTTRSAIDLKSTSKINQDQACRLGIVGLMGMIWSGLRGYVIATLCLAGCGADRSTPDIAYVGSGNSDLNRSGNSDHSGSTRSTIEPATSRTPLWRARIRDRRRCYCNWASPAGNRCCECTVRTSSGLSAYRTAAS